jgi:hypothetical protein
VPLPEGHATSLSVHKFSLDVTPPTMDSVTEAPYKLIELKEGDWNDWHFEQQQLMIVAHVSPFWIL